MLAKKDKDTVIAIAEKYNVKTVYLFGSSMGDPKLAHDIDLGVIGVTPPKFFQFYAELMRNLPKPVDLIDLSEKSLFNDLVKERGIKIYIRPPPKKKKNGRSKKKNK